MRGRATPGIASPGRRQMVEVIAGGSFGQEVLRIRIIAGEFRTHGRSGFS